MFEIYLTDGAKPQGGVLVSAFPSVGMVGTIAANYISDAMEMNRIAQVVSDELPPAALIRDGIPGYPVRIMSKGRLAILVSEFQLPVALSAQFSKALLDWADANGYGTIVCLEGLMSEKSMEQTGEVRVFGVGSSESSRDMLAKTKIEQFKTGVITGVSGSLLSEAQRLGRDVICYLADANAMYPDARGAAKLVETVSAMLPSVDVDVKELLEEAQKIEENVRATVDRTKEMLSAKQGQAERLGKSYIYA